MHGKSRCRRNRRVKNWPDIEQINKLQMSSFFFNFEIFNSWNWDKTLPAIPLRNNELFIIGASLCAKIIFELLLRNTLLFLLSNAIIAVLFSVSCFQARVRCSEPILHTLRVSTHSFAIDCISSLSASSVLCNKQNSKNADGVNSRRATNCKKAATQACTV